MSAHLPTKALLLAVQSDPAPAIRILQQLNPEMVCFFLEESCQQMVESDIHPALAQMPKRWDWILTTNPASFPDCHKALAKALGPLLIEQLATWSRGRAIEPHEDARIEALTSAFEEGGEQFRELVVVMVTDDAMRFIRKEGH